MQQELETLKDWIDHSDNIVFFGGAGVSTESGIPDFRSVDGLYNQQYDYPPETILSHTFFQKKYGRVLSVLPGEDACTGRKTQCGTQEAGPVGAGRQVKTQL